MYFKLVSIEMFIYWFLFIFVSLFLHQVELKSYTTIDVTSSNNCQSIDFDHCKTNCCNPKEEKVVICYFTNWAWYREGRASFRPENINATLCTHILYAFTILDSKTLLINVSDEWADIENHFIEDVIHYQQQGVKVLTSIGGWTNSGGDHWSRMLNNVTAREIFVDNACKFLKKYKFDGIDLDYEYPSCPQGNLAAGLPDETENFNKLVKELKQTCNKNGQRCLVTAAVAAGENILKKCYNLTGLCEWLDWIHIMTYDYAGSTDRHVGALAPMCGTGSTWGVFETVQYYLNECNCQLVLGIPFYGLTFTVKGGDLSKAVPIWGAPASGPGNAGIYTKNAGTLSYYEICLLVKAGWDPGNNKVNDSYALNGNQCVSFDSDIDIIRKSCLIIKYNLKGAMIWTLDYDDFNNLCGDGSYPLLKALNAKLRCLNPSQP